jgi:hypothetical protein
MNKECGAGDILGVGTRAKYRFWKLVLKQRSIQREGVSLYEQTIY